MAAGGKTSVLRLLGGGWGELVLPDQKGVTKVVISILITISLVRGHSILLQLLCFNPRHSNIFKIFPTKLYGYTRRHRDWRCVTAAHFI